MKKLNVLGWLLAVMLVLVWISPTWAGIGDKLYFSKFPTTIEDLVDRWGEPVAMHASHDGYDFYVFDYGYQGGIWENRYFVVKDGRVIDGGYNFNQYTVEEWPRPGGNS